MIDHFALETYSTRAEGIAIVLDYMRDFFENATKNRVKINKKTLDVVLRDLMELRYDIAEGLDQSETYLKFTADWKEFVGITTEKRINWEKVRNGNQRSDNAVPASVGKSVCR